MKMNKKYVSASLMALGVLTMSSMVAQPAFAADLGLKLNTQVNINADKNESHPVLRMMGDQDFSGGILNNGHRIFGTVTAISGTTITVSSKNNATNTTTTYTINAANAKIDKNKAAITISGIAVGDLIVAEGPVTGTTLVAASIHDGDKINMPGGPDMNHGGIAGKVTAVSGSTITVSGKKGPTTVTYSVNAANAVVTKNGATSTVSAIAVGDEVKIEGKVSGTAVTATRINDGKMPEPVMPQGNGQPIVGGTVTAVSGNTITITNKSNISYTIDATSATFIKNGANATLSSIAVGDSVVAQGAVNGTTVTAASVTDQGKAETGKPAGESKGFLGSIASFFGHLFGF